MHLTEAFTTLGLTGRESLDTIEAAYRRLRSKWHPDRNKAAEAHERMSSINQAVEILRAQVAHPGPGRAATAGGGRSKPPMPDEPYPARARGADISRKVQVSIAEAAFGCKKVIKGSITDICAECAGRGEVTYVCGNCKGSTGFLSRFGCPKCSGQGTFDRQCRKCKGTGRSAKRSWIVEVEIPAGVTQGALVRARGFGGLGVNASNGDLLVAVSVADHKIFQLDSAGQLQAQVPISIFQWILGGEIVVPVLDGFETVTILPYQDEIELDGRGWPTHGKKQAGTLRVNLTIEFPESLTKEQAAMVARLTGETTSKGMKSWQQQMLDWANLKTRWQAPKRTRPNAA